MHCPSSPLILRALPILFFFSGASSLIFESLFTRLLTYTFGNTAYAVSTVLAAFLGGLALGAFLLGQYTDQWRPSAWIYGALELVVGVYALFIPKLFALLTRVYVGVYHHLHSAPGFVTPIRFALSAAVILIPTILMGGTLPVLARLVADARSDYGPEVSRLYAWNTLGAALGALAAAYLLMPALGVRGTIAIASGINFSLFVIVMALARGAAASSDRDGSIPVPAPQADEGVGTTVSSPPPLLFLAVFLTGTVALAYEVLWTHILSFLIGNTVYAFGVMLFTFLVGLGWGAQIVARQFPHPESGRRAFPASQILLALTVLLTLPLWNHLPDAFAGGFAQALNLDIVGIAFLIVCRMANVGWKTYRRATGATFPWFRLIELAIEALLLIGIFNANAPLLLKYETPSFIAGELLRFLCAFYLLILPSLLLGLSFPLLLNLSSGVSGLVGKRVGGLYAANTVGAIAGSLICGFVLLPHFGSFSSLQAAAAGNLVIGLGFAMLWAPLNRASRTALAVAALTSLTIFWVGPRGWNARSMTRGSYVYFTEGWPVDQVLYFKEDVQGGLTSVVQMGSTRLLLSNGKFQGNNTGEVGGQIRFATIPMLFTRRFDKALVIGLGTGNTLRTVSRFPFARIDAVELAPHIVDAARLWFDDVNERVFDHDSRVHLSIADGRNFLLLSSEHYDLMTIEVSSIWISGEADLYNKEFYELCRSHLTEQGVLQQWVQIHHMRTQDFLVILNTAAQVFPHVAFFMGPEQGVLIASSAPLSIDARQTLAFDADPKIQKEMKVLGVSSMASLLGELMLEGESMRRALSFLPGLSGLPGNFASTDFYPYLEYQTPKGNALPYDTYSSNLQFMQSLRPPPIPPDLPIQNFSSEDEKLLFTGFVVEERGDLASALEIFRRVQGPPHARALAEIALLESKLAKLAR
ncbi:MAG TPA: fused MFS/spermidine synthase [Terriglobia bacterium]|nr:fused MFS/spermidine synthase [Terriglobia bacterium]